MLVRRSPPWEETLQAQFGHPGQDWCSLAFSNRQGHTEPLSYLVVAVEVAAHKEPYLLT